MGEYKVRAPDGREVTIEGPAPPSEEDLDAIFASLPPPGASVSGPAPPPPPADFPTLSGGPTEISATPFMQRSITDILGFGPSLEAIKAGSGPGGGIIPALESVTPMSVTESAPSVMAAVGAMAAAPVSIPAAVGMAGLMAMGGVGFKRLGQAAGDVPITDQEGLGRALFPRGIPASIWGDLTEIIGTGTKEMTFEVVGQLIFKVLRLGGAPDRVAALAEDLGLPPPLRTLKERIARKTISGEALATRAARKGQDKALTRASEEGVTLGQPPPVPEESALRYIRETESGFKASERAAETAAKGEHRAATATYEQ
ncbi:hypothetical protein LCGC14_3013130, partial [marine sediment metagenome]